MVQYGMMYWLIAESTNVLVSDTSMVQYGMMYQLIVESTNVYVDGFTDLPVLVIYQVQMIKFIKNIFIKIGIN